jgi:hypothetical protein
VVNRFGTMVNTVGLAQSSRASFRRVAKVTTNYAFPYVEAEALILQEEPCRMAVIGGEVDWNRSWRPWAATQRRHYADRINPEALRIVPDGRADSVSVLEIGKLIVQV